MIISPGNSKLGQVVNVGLPPIKTCIKDAPCASKCYAIKAYRLWPSVRQGLDLNLKLWEHAPDLYFSFIRRYLELPQLTTRLFRWHVSGDIPSQSYLNKMIDLARDFSHWRFLAYTKKYRLDFRQVPENLNVYFSIWPKLRKPVKKMGITAMAYLSTDRRAPKGAFLCRGKCSTCCYCYSNKAKDVKFDPH